MGFIGAARGVSKLATSVQDDLITNCITAPLSTTFEQNVAGYLYSATVGRHMCANALCNGAVRWPLNRPTSTAVVSLIGGVGSMVPAALCMQCCRSKISSFRKDGYYRFERPGDIEIHDSCYSVLTVRGGGPGGQGANSSSNKVELRASIAAIQEHFEEHLVRKLKENEQGKALTADGAFLIITSHEHRSAHHNKEACVKRLKEMIHRASWVPPVEPGPIMRSTAVVTAQKADRRKKSLAKKMQRTARSGLW